MTNTIKVQASRRMNAHVVEAIEVKRFGKDIQALFQNGDLWGAFARLDGRVVVIDRSMEEHGTDVTVNSINRPAPEDADYHVVCLSSHLFDAHQYPRIETSFDDEAEAEAEVLRLTENDEYQFALAYYDETGRLIDSGSGEVIELA